MGQVKGLIHDEDGPVFWAIEAGLELVKFEHCFLDSISLNNLIIGILIIWTCASKQTDSEQKYKTMTA
jgi:hypothetical protein